MAIRPFKIELIKEQTNERVSFGPRSFGDVGRDIMIVKRALGQIIPYSELIDDNDENPSLEREDPNGWFDCVSGQIATSREAATFDSNLQNYLMKFQLDNQFYILCYNFIKFNIAETLEKREDFKKRRTSVPEPSWYNPARAFQAIGAAVTDGLDATLETITGNFSSDEVLGTMPEEDEKFFMALQIDVMLEMFISDFGRISEATLAVMHGWRPRTSIGNTSYYHDDDIFSDQDGAYDMVIRGLWESFVNNDLQQKFVLADNDGSILEPTANEFEEAGRGLDAYKGTGAKAIEFAEKYKEQVSAFEDVNIGDDDYYFKSEHFGVLKYSLISKSRKSILFSAFETAMEYDPREPGVHNMSSEDYSNAARRAFEPDPLTDPDPFIIDASLIGYFSATSFTMANLPPMAEDEEYRQTISELEDRALTQVLEFYGKPHVWFHKEEDPVFQGYYGVNRNPNMSTFHSERFTDSSNYAITTKENAEKINRQLTSYQRNQAGEIISAGDHTRGAFHHYQDIDYSSYEQNIIYNSSEKPLVQFVEFRTPSLRPGDFYRAKFLINKKKLDYITEGYYHQEEQQDNANEEQNRREVEQVSANTITPTCDDTPPSLEMQERRFQEYKALAAKRRREIARTLREKALETYETEAAAATARVDLGVFGNANLNFGNWQTDSPEFRNMLIDNLGAPIYDYTFGWANGIGGPQNFNAGSVGQPFKDDFPNEDSYTFEDLSHLLERGSKAIKDAYENCVKQQVTFKGINGFNGALEAAKLSGILGEIRRIIEKDPNTKNFNFGSGGFFGVDDSAPSGAAAGLNAGSAFLGLPQSRIKIKFAQTSGGLKVVKISAGSATVSNLESHLKPGMALARPRTVGYLAQVRSMAGRQFFTSGAGALEKVKTLLSDNDGSCSDLGLGQKGLAFLVKHTLGLSGTLKEFNPINQWASENFATPAKEWFKRNTEYGMFDYDEKFGTDEFLNTIGDNCKSVSILFHQFLDKFSPLQFLCDYLKCLKLPAINLTIPNFRIPDKPKLPIFGWWWWLIKFMLDRFVEILVRMLCTFIKFILDLLQNPICKDQLTDELFGTASMATPGVQAALAEGFLDMELDKREKDAAKQLVDEIGLFLTADELCRLLQGETLDAATTNMILKISSRLGISSIGDEEALAKFFEVITLFLPDGFCTNLQQATFIPGASSCETTADYLSQVRRRMLANEATDEEIQQAIDMANTNLMDSARALEVLGQGGFTAMIPEVYEFGNDNALMSDIPPNLKQSSERTATQIFDTVKTSYLTSLTLYKNSFFLNHNRLPHPRDEKFNEKSVLTVETILENLKLFSIYAEQSAGTVTEGSLHTQLYLLHQVYEIEHYPALFDETRKLISKVYLRPNTVNLRNLKLPQTRVSEFSEVSYDSRSTYDPSAIKERFYLKPVGYSLNGYMFIDEETERPSIIQPIDPEVQGEEDIDYSRVPLDIAAMASPSNFLNSNTSPLSDHGSVGLYKLLKRAIASQDPEDVDANNVGNQESIKFLQQLINERLNKMQQDLSREMENMFAPLPTDEFLAIIKDKFDASFENVREALRNPGQGDQEAEVIDVLPEREGQNYNSVYLTMELGYSNPTIYLREFPSTESANNFDPYTVEIMPGLNDSYLARSSLLRNQTSFTYCDSMPGPGLNLENASIEQVQDSGIYLRAISDIPTGLYTRREVMSRQYWESVNSAVSQVFDQEWDNSQDVLSEKRVLGSFRTNFLRDNFYNDQFTDFKEGIFEQIFFALRRSRLFDEEYFDSYIRRVMGRIQVASDGCYKNRYNISSLGALSFEKIVTDEFPAQLQAELARPENAPENLDFDDLGPFEKALQNVCIIGYVRICIVEFLLKGAIPLSVWDVEGIAEEPLIHDYIYHFVHEELERRSISEHWPKAIERVTGISNPGAALKDTVKKQFLKLIGTSKTIFANPEDIDYYNWFVKYGIPQADVSRKYVVSNYETINVASDFAFTSASFDAENPEELVLDRRLLSDHNNDPDFTFISPELEGGGQNLFRPGKFYWSHPLEDSRNIVIDPNYAASGLLTPDPDVIHDTLLNGSNNFFHIEHYIEVTGPLSRLESIVLPVRKIVEDITNLNVQDALDSETIEDDKYITDPAIPRVPQQMNVLAARERFGGDRVFQVDIANYRISQTPMLPLGPSNQSRGSSFESSPLMIEGREVRNFGDDHNSNHEIFNVKDFIEGIRAALSAEDIEKYFYHLQLRLTYDESPDTAPGGSALNTSVEAAHGKSEVIRRTPTRFITRKRRFISFTRDMFLNDIDEYFDGNHSLINYKNALYNATNSEHLFENSEHAESIRHFLNFKNFCEISSVDNDRFYVKTSNGEELLQLEEDLESENFSITNLSNEFDYGLRSEAPIRFLQDFYELDASNNNSNSDTKRPTLVSNTLKDYADLGYNSNNENLRARQYNENLTNELKEAFFKDGYFYNELPFLTVTGSNSYITSNKDFGENFDTTLNTLEYESVEGDPQVIFENLYGSFGEDRELFERAIANARSDINFDLDNFVEETYLETVFSFTDLGSLITGLRSSYNIAETFDRSVFDFKASEEVKTLFDNSLREVINLLGYKYDQADDSHFEIENLKDTKLSQYGRTFYKLKSEEGEIRIARPMGIDGGTNRDLTQRVIVKTPWSNAIEGTTDDLQQQDLEGNRYIYNRAEAPIYYDDFSFGAWAQPDRDFKTSSGLLTIQPQRDVVYRGANVDQTRNLAIMEDISASRLNTLQMTAPLFKLPVSEASKNLFEKPRVVFDEGRMQHIIMLSSDSNLLAPNLYKVPLRVLLTQIFREGETTPSEVYCKVVPPSYFEPDRNSPGDVPRALTKVSGDQEGGNIDLLNRAVKKIAEEYIDLARSVSASLLDRGLEEEEEGFRLRHPVLPVEDIRRNLGLGSFPDFTSDFGNNSDARGDTSRSFLRNHGFYHHPDNERLLNQYTQKSNLDITSKQKFCSIERIYSEVFKLETESDFFNSRQEIDELFQDRGFLVKKESSEINTSILQGYSGRTQYGGDYYFSKRQYLESKNYFYQNTRWDSNSSIELESASAFHKMIFNMHNVINEYMNHRTAGKASFWGLLSDYRKKYYRATTFENRDREVTTGTLHHYSSALAASRREAVPHALLYSRLSSRYLTHYMQAFADRVKEKFLGADNTGYPNIYKFMARGLSIPGTFEPPEHMFFHKYKSVPAVLCGPLEDGPLLAYENGFSEPPGAGEVVAGLFEDGNKRRRAMVFGQNLFGQPEAFATTEPGLMMAMPNKQDILELRTQFYRPFLIEDEYKDGILTNHFCSFKSLIPSYSNRATNGHYFDGTGYDYVNYNQVSDCKIDYRYSSMYHCSGKISLIDLSVFIKSAIKNTIRVSAPPESQEEIINYFFKDTTPADVYEYFKMDVFFKNLNNLKYMKQIYLGAGLDKNDDMVIGRFEFDDEIFSKQTLLQALGLTQGQISSQAVRQLVDTLENVISSMCYLLGTSFQYKTYNEMASRPGQKKTYSLKILMVLERLIKKIKKDRYGPLETLAILSLISDPISFNKSYLKAANKVDYRRSYRESIEDWAVACMHFLLLHISRASHSATQRFFRDTYEYVGFDDFAEPGSQENGFMPYIQMLRYDVEVLENSNNEFNILFRNKENSQDDGFRMQLNLGQPADRADMVAPFWTTHKKNSNAMISYLIGNAYRDRITQDLSFVSIETLEKIINYANVFRYQYLLFSTDHSDIFPESEQRMPILPAGNYGSIRRAVYPNNNSLILQILREQLISADLYRRGKAVPFVGTEEDIAIENSAFYEQAFNKYVDGISSVASEEDITKIGDEFASELDNFRRIESRYITESQIYSITAGHCESFMSNLDLDMFYNLFVSPPSNENYNSKIDRSRPDAGSINNQNPGPQFDDANSAFSSFRANLRDAPENASSSPMIDINSESIGILENSPFISSYLIERYNLDYMQTREQATEKTPKQIYLDVMKKALFGSKSVFGSLTSKLFVNTIDSSYLTNMRRGVDIINARYRTAFRNYSGITQNVLDASMLDEAFIDGVLVKGLIKSSTIKQGCRLIGNTFEGTWDGTPNSREENITLSLQDSEGKNVLRDYKTIQNISEEYRTFYMINNRSENNTFSVPLSKYEYITSPEGEAYFDECTDLPEYLQLYNERRSQLVEHLLEEATTKLVFNYALPVKRYQSVSTIFATDALASYNNMPKVMESPKATLSSIMNIVTMNRKQRNELFNDVSQAEYFKTMLDDANTNPDGMSCFSNPFDEEFWSAWWDMFAELIQLFPSILFRGIADTIDPAYKEMKVHWSGCKIKELTHDGLRPWDSTAGMDYEDMKAGLYLPGGLDNPNGGHGKGLYAPIIPQMPIDLLDSLGTIVDSKFRRGYGKLGSTLARTVGYAYKGPISLVEGLFSFSIPCAGFGEDELGTWGDKTFNTGRYGHPYSPLTGLALMTKQLPGDLRIRRNSGACNDVIPIPAFPTPEQACPVEDVPAPFGSFNDSED